jgi:hypothetical protein
MTVISIVTVVRTSYLICSKDVSAIVEGGIHVNLRGVKWRCEKGNYLLRGSTIGVAHRLLMSNGIKNGGHRALLRTRNKAYEATGYRLHVIQRGSGAHAICCQMGA